MKNLFLLCVVFCCLTTYGKSPFWGKTGHRATAQIASTYLTKKAAKKVHALLDGDGMALVSTFGDEIKSNHRYDQYKVWHYINIPEGKTYAEVKNDLGPNIISAIKTCKAGLQDQSTSRQKKQFYLKMLIHLIGDLHQPLHLGHPEDLGGNKIIVFWFNEPSNLHRVWDENLLDSYKMSYSELAKNQSELDQKELKSIQQGDVIDWLKETRTLTKKIYKSADNGGRLSYKYMYDWMPVVRKQLQKGGIRLAKELNEIFG